MNEQQLAKIREYSRAQWEADKAANGPASEAQIALVNSALREGAERKAAAQLEEPK